MAKALFTNNAAGTLSAAVASTDTLIYLGAGQGALFPTITGSDYFYITVTMLASPYNMEIMKVTTVSTDTLTVTRGQDNTVANVSGFAISDPVELRVTAKVLQELQPGKLLGLTKFLSSNASWTPNSNTTKIVVCCIGGGGNGGNASTSGAGGGGGGGAGQVVWGEIETILSSYSVTVGAAGGTSSFGSVASAVGGGNGGNAVSTVTTGGAGGHNGGGGTGGAGYCTGTAGNSGYSTSAGTGGTGSGTVNSGAGGGGGGAVPSIQFVDRRREWFCWGAWYCCEHWRCCSSKLRSRWRRLWVSWYRKYNFWWNWRSGWFWNSRRLGVFLMSTSGTTTFSLTRDDIINYALRKIGRLDLGSTPDSTMVANTATALDMMIKSWITRGIKLWTINEIVLTLVSSQTKYVVGPTGTDLVTDKPMKLKQAWLRDISVTPQTDIPLNLISQYDYNLLGSKFSTGTANSIYMEVGRDNSNIYLYLTPDTYSGTNYQLHFVTQRTYTRCWSFYKQFRFSYRMVIHSWMEFSSRNCS